MVTSRSILLRMRIFQTNVAQKMKTHFIFNHFFFFRKSCLLRDNVEIYCIAGQATDDILLFQGNSGWANALQCHVRVWIYIKVKIKWSLYRPGAAQRVGRGIALLFHDRGTRRGWVVSSTPRPHFTPRERPGTHCPGGWVGPRAGLAGRKISSPPGFEPGPSSP